MSKFGHLRRAQLSTAQVANQPQNRRTSDAMRHARASAAAQALALYFAGSYSAANVPSPTLSPTDPVPRGLPTLCPGASSGPQGLYTAYIQPIYGGACGEGERTPSAFAAPLPLPCPSFCSERGVPVHKTRCALVLSLAPPATQQGNVGMR